MQPMEIGTPLNYHSFNDHLARQVQDYLNGQGIVPDEISDLLGAVNRTYNDMGARIRQLEEEKKAATARGGGKDRETRFFEQFVNIVSHNLRAPVANIKALGELLHKGSLGKSEQEKCLSALYMTAQKIDELVCDLANMQRLVIREENTRQDLLLSAVINDIRTLLAHSIEHETVVFELDLEVDRVCSVKSYLMSILYNLIVNSIRYRRQETVPRIVIRSECLESSLILTVKDNGMGIDLEENGNNLFGPYQKFTNAAEGSGLGLFIVKTQVEILGGTISAESEPSRGAKFTISLPL